MRLLSALKSRVVERGRMERFVPDRGGWQSSCKVAMIAVDGQDHVSESVAAISAIHLRAEQRLTSHQRGIERVTSWVGRPRTVYALVAFAAAWVALNLALGAHAFDRPPFTILQVILTFLALLVTVIVLITQSRQLGVAEKRGHLDLEIGLLTDRKIAKVIALLEELRRDLPNVPHRRDAEAEAMEEETDPHSLADALEQAIESEDDSGHEGPPH